MQILNTKFHIPQINDKSVIFRKELLDSMDPPFKNRFVLVSAPAGFGKTTFLSQWVQKGDLARNTAWLSLNGQDNHLARFWTYVIQAIHKKIPHDLCVPLLELLQCPSSEPFENIIIQLINCLDNLNFPMVLILDDFHVITDQQILDSFNFFIDHSVPDLVIVLSTRKVPPLGLSRLRLTGGFREVHQGDLAFSLNETRRFIMASQEGNALAPETIQRLNSRTEGWIAGLKLAMISLKDSRDKQKFISDFTENNRYILDYLVEEVLLRLPAKIRAFMLRISLLPRFNADLCSTLTCRENSFEYLRYMEQHNLFLIPLDGQGNWFRYHHLFRDCLKKILEQENKDELPTLYTRALQWFNSNGYFEDAFDIAVESRDIETAVNILAKIIPEVFRSGGEQFIVPFLQRLNENTIFSNATLTCYHLWIGMVNGNFDLISKLEPMLKESRSREDRELLQGFYDLFQGYALFYLKGDLFLAMEKCKNALALIPKTHYAVRRMTEHLVSIQYRFLGNLKKAVELSRERKEDNLFMSVLSIMNRADQELELGNLSKAHDIIKQKLDTSIASFQGNIPVFFGFIYAVMGIVLREKNRLDEAAVMFSRAIPLCRESGFLEMIPVAYMEQARLYAARQEFENAHAAIDLAIEISAESSFWALGSMRAWKARFCLMEGKTKYPETVAAGFHIEADMEIPFIRSMEYIFFVRYLIYIGKYEKASFIIDIMMAQDIAHQRNGRLLECLILKAKLLFLQENPDHATDCLARAFGIAREQGHVRLFLDEYPAMAPLFHKALEQGMVPVYLQEWISSISTPVESRKKQKVSIMLHDCEEQFNSREVNVLRFMQQGSSNREIADELHLSVNTVRWYARQIFSKLNVNTRGKAATRALELGII